MANSLRSNCKRDLWAEVEKTSCVKTMNGKQGIESIGKLFADNYKELYNSVSYNCSKMNSINTYIIDKIISDCDANVCNVSHNIDVTDVQNAVQFLKHNKSDGTNELYSDAIINEVMSCIIICLCYFLRV